MPGQPDVSTPSGGGAVQDGKSVVGYLVVAVVACAAAICSRKKQPKGGAAAPLPPSSAAPSSDGIVATTTANPAGGSGYTPPSLAQTRSGKEPPPVFISFRVGEGLAEVRCRATPGLRQYLVSRSNSWAGRSDCAQAFV